jgi:hypothetical protein
MSDTVFLKIATPDLKSLVDKLVLLQNDGPIAIKRGLRHWAEMVAEIAKTTRVPVAAKRGGTLRASIFVKPEENTNSVVLGAGGPAEPYALAVHEHLSKYSPPSWQGKPILNWHLAGTGPKYLENPVNENKDKLVDYVTEEVDIELAKSGLK